MNKLIEIVERFEGCQVAVIGDLILDEFIWGTVDRISPEAPVPVVRVTRESECLGGAANVAQNLKALGAEPVLIGVIGEDEAGERFIRCMRDLGLSEECMIRDSDRRTTIKTRIIAHHQQVCRADRETGAPLTSSKRSRLIESASEVFRRSRSVVLSDYAKGVLTDGIGAELIARARNNERFVAVDPKVSDFRVYQSASIITPNKKETEHAAGIPVTSEEDLLRAGRSILEEAGVENLLVTRGEEGMTLFEGEEVSHIPTVAREVFDVTGAGDTVIGTFSLAIAAGATIREAALLANHAAGIVVGKLGTATASKAELLASLNGD